MVLLRIIYLVLVSKVIMVVNMGNRRHCELVLVMEFLGDKVKAGEIVYSLSVWMFSLNNWRMLWLAYRVITDMMRKRSLIGDIVLSRKVRFAPMLGKTFFKCRLRLKGVSCTSKFKLEFFTRYKIWSQIKLGEFLRNSGWRLGSIVWSLWWSCMRKLENLKRFGDSKFLSKIWFDGHFHM